MLSPCVSCKNRTFSVIFLYDKYSRINTIRVLKYFCFDACFHKMTLHALVPSSKATFRGLFPANLKLDLLNCIRSLLISRASNPNLFLISRASKSQLQSITPRFLIAFDHSSFLDCIQSDFTCSIGFRSGYSTYQVFARMHKWKQTLFLTFLSALEKLSVYFGI
ncbi:hypothetical protein L2E82_46274 [Cichorium intybus]|uniref:Uncharacterized protein n=1 Tax=Cichorium intybus TaxID=13427 RepID=A0ACB8YTA0_CICIN|nr:hypothetical protein L2E82_46274 [Cichorium intybus]